MADSADIIVISDSESDAEKEESKKNLPSRHKALFDEFFSHCHGLLSKIRDERQVQKVEKHVLKVHQAARPDYVTSEEFANSLERHLVELRKPELVPKNVFTHIHDVVVLLKSARTRTSSKKDPGPPTDESEDKKPQESNVINGDKATTSKESKQAEDKPGVSGGLSNEDENPSTSDPNKFKVRRMEKLMDRLDKEITKYSNKELSVEDMNREDSAHIIEHKLRERFVKAWQKWCKLKGYETKTGRATEKKLKFQGSRFPEINRKIQKLINRGKFPDFHDVYRVINRANNTHGLGIHRFDLHQLSKEVFEDVGKRIRDQRAQDYICNFGYANLSEVPEDPANESPDLKARLEENANIGRQMMNSVFEKYTQKQNECMSKGINMDVDETSELEGGEKSEGEWEEWDGDDGSIEEEEAATEVMAERDEGKVEVGDAADGEQLPANEKICVTGVKRPAEETKDIRDDQPSKKLKDEGERLQPPNDIISNGTSSEQSETNSEVKEDEVKLEGSEKKSDSKPDNLNPLPCMESKTEVVPRNASEDTNNGQASDTNSSLKGPNGFHAEKFKDAESTNASEQKLDVTLQRLTPLSRKNLVPPRRIQALHLGPVKSEPNTVENNSGHSEHINGILKNSTESHHEGQDNNDDDDDVIILD